MSPFSADKRLLKSCQIDDDKDAVWKDKKIS